MQGLKDSSITDNNFGQEDKLLIRGDKPLRGEVIISGAKNAVLKLMAAAILVPGEVTLQNVPPLNDVLKMVEILEFLGGKCNYNKEREILKLDFSDITSIYAPYELVSKLRASFVILGPLVARMHEAKVSLPGGCQIGSRKIDLHKKGLEKLGAKLDIEHGYVEATTNGKNLQGCEIYLDIPSNGATENLMMAAVLADGITVIQNAAKDPEIVDLADFLNTCGARIKGAGTQNITIEGVSKYQLKGVTYSCLPDRIEAGTFLIAGLATKGNVTVKNVVPHHLDALLSKLKDCGADLTIQDNSINIATPIDGYTGTDINTVWYPGFPTDLQPQMAALLTMSQGASIVKESIFEDRFSHVYELNRMGSSINLNNNIANITGVTELSGTKVRGTDLRATAGLAIAGLMAKGVTEVYGLDHLDRGYSKFVEKLQGLGAEITRASAN